MAPALPRKMAPPSSPASRSPSRAPWWVSIAKARPVGQQVREQDRDPEQARRDPRQQPTVGIEREREQQDHDEPEREDLSERDPGAGLDAQVLARDERGLPPDHGVTPGCGVGRAPGGDRPGHRRPGPHAWRAGGRPRARATPSRRCGPRPARPRRPRPRTARPVGVETGVRLVEQQQLGLAHQRDRQRQAAALPGGEAAVGHAGRRSSATRSSTARDRRRIVAARRAGEEPDVLLGGEVVVAVGLVTDERGPGPGRRAGR